MKILIDTNVHLDLIQRRATHIAESSALLRKCRTEHIEMLVAWHSVANIWYIARKTTGARWTEKAIRLLLRTATVPAGGTAQLQRACELGLTDFEDAMHAAIAEFAGADYIATRNVSDFVRSSVPAKTPGELLAFL